MAETEELQNLGDEEWKSDVQNNLTYLAKHTENLTEILTGLIQHEIISHDEMQYILNEQHPHNYIKKNYEMWIKLKAKGWIRVKDIFLQILRDTLNHDCVDVIKFGCIETPTTSTFNNQIIPAKKNFITGAINSKWWPAELRLPTSFFERKIENELLTEKLKKMLTQNQNKTTVINQQVTVSGLGGIGKTITAKSFAVKYAEDYDWILWIDCGEGSLLRSFENLSRDLGVENRKLELKRLACRIFEILKESKCLFIFDNAECYVGNEGIRDVLPKNRNNFHTIITSRNREWGQENIDGQISEFQLDVFGEDEALEFMKNNIPTLDFCENDETKIKILCRLLSYLPLALQIAVSTLNKSKMSLDKYIKKLKTSDDILEAKLDGYERTIYKTLKITLELIQNHEKKNVTESAIKILSVFGYITPDGVDVDFFIDVLVGKKGFFAKLQENFLFRRKKLLEMEKQEAAFSKIREEASEAIEMLQFYSIISKIYIPGKPHQLSIHRLFQQVIRHNTKDKQNKILRQIFKCDMYLDYKLVPFTYYADPQLQKEFPKLKADLINILDLKNLLKYKRFPEAAELSRLIKDSIQTPVSFFNLALCLQYNHENEEAKKILQGLLNNTKSQGTDATINKIYESSFLMDSETELTREPIAWGLFLIYLEEKDEEAARQIFLSELINRVELKNVLDQRRFKEAVALSQLIKDSIQTPVSIFNWALCLKYNHEKEEAKKILQQLLNSTKRHGNINEINVAYYNFLLIMNSYVELTFDHVAFELFVLYCEEKDEEAARQIFLSATQMELRRCSLNSSVLSLLPQSLQKLKLEKCTISNCIRLSSDLKELILESNDFVDDDVGELRSLGMSQLIPLNLQKLQIYYPICVSLDLMNLIPSVHLEYCSLILVPGLHMTPEELTLKHVKFFAADNESIGNVLVNDFVDFRRMKELTLWGSGMSIDFCDLLTLNYLRLIGTKVVDWKKANWTVHKLKLWGVDFVDRTGMKVTEMEIEDSSVDLSVLPSTIQKLDLKKCTLVNFSFSPVGGIKLLPNLTELSLRDIKTNKEKTLAIHDILPLLGSNCDNWKTKTDNGNKDT